MRFLLTMSVCSRIINIDDNNNNNNSDDCDKISSNCVLRVMRDEVSQKFAVFLEIHCYCSSANMPSSASHYRRYLDDKVSKS